MICYSVFNKSECLYATLYSAKMNFCNTLIVIVIRPLSILLHEKFRKA